MKISIGIRLGALAFAVLAAGVAPTSMQAQSAKKAAVGTLKGVKHAKIAKVRGARKRHAKGKKHLHRVVKTGTPAQQAWARSAIVERKSLAGECRLRLYDQKRRRGATESLEGR